MSPEEDDREDSDSDSDNPVFQSRTFPQYRPRPRPTQSQYVPATPRAATNYGADDTPSSFRSSSRASSSSTSTFFFTISSSSSSSTPTHLLHPNSSSYRCTFRGRDAISFRRKLPPNINRDKLKQRLSVIGTIRHTNVVQLVGASMPENQVPYVNLVYSFVNGPTLSDCLTSTATATPTTSSDDPISFVSTWVSRMEIALGVARGLDYIHNRTGFDAVFVHNRIKSSNIILTYTHHEFVRSTKPQICNFGLAHAAGETAADDDDVGGGERQPLMEDEEGYPYMSPELHREGIATQKSDVYAFGVLLLELISGKEPLTYRYDDASKAYVRTSVVESARAIFLDEGEEERTEEEKVKCWVDGRLNRLFPVKLAIKAIRIALLCVTEDPKLRPDMGFVEGLIFECSLQSNSNRVFF